MNPLMYECIEDYCYALKMMDNELPHIDDNDLLLLAEEYADLYSNSDSAKE